MWYCNVDLKWGMETVAEFELKREAMEFAYDHNSLLENTHERCKVSRTFYEYGKVIPEEQVLANKLKYLEGL